MRLRAGLLTASIFSSAAVPAFTQAALTDAALAVDGVGPLAPGGRQHGAVDRLAQRERLGERGLRAAGICLRGVEKARGLLIAQHSRVAGPGDQMGIMAQVLQAARVATAARGVGVVEA